MNETHAAVTNAAQRFEAAGFARPIFTTVYALDNQCVVEDLVEFSEAGGIPVVPAGISFERFEEALAALQGRTFAVALRIPPLEVDFGEVARVDEAMTEFWREIGVEESPLKNCGNLLARIAEDFRARFEAALKARPIAMISTAGGFREPEEDALREAGVMNIGAATTLKEAKVLRAARVDAVLAQGAEAEGPRQNFEDPDDAMTGLAVLVPSIAEATGLPVIAWGGVYCAAQVRGLEEMGAFGFVVGPSTVPMSARRRAAVDEDVLALYPYASASDAKFTRVVNGRLARIIPSSIHTVLSNFDEVLTEKSHPAMELILEELVAAGERRGESWLNFEFADSALGRARYRSASELVRALSS